MIAWVYYIVVMNANHSIDIEVKHFNQYSQCEKYMHSNHKKLIKLYYQPEVQKMTGGGCRREGFRVPKKGG